VKPGISWNPWKFQ